MPDPSFGTWLRGERERRGTPLKAISDQTKVSLPLLEALEVDDLSRWPSGIFRRAFVRSYASAIGLDPDAVMKRFEAEHCPIEAAPLQGAEAVPPADAPAAPATAPVGVRWDVLASQRTRLLGTAADLTVALVLGLGSAAAGSRLLWPVLLIAFYYALGVLLTGTSPMVALLSDQAESTAGESHVASTASAQSGSDGRLAGRRGASPAGRSSRSLRQTVQ
jgi:helix-turn-helix protein